MKNAYVTALTESILAGTDIELALTRLRARLERQGHLRLYGQILKASARVLGAKLKETVPQVVVAKAGGVSRETLLSAIARLSADQTTYEEQVDETIVGGFIIRFKDQVLDASYKRRLLDLYRHITK